MNVGTLTIFLGVTTSGINKAIRDAQRFERSVVTSAQSAQEALLSFGRVATQFLTFPLSIIGGVATKTFSDFEYNLAKVTGLVGIASDQTKEWGEELKDLASAVGKSPKELSEALYFVTTGGIRGAETMDVLTVAAKAAAAGLGETQQVADLLVSAMNAYGKENLSAARAADILVASVKEGKAEAPALAQSMGIVLPIASKLGVSFDQVGAAMAGMTRTGTKAATAAMQTRQILNKIVKPAEQSKEAIKKVGTSFEELRHIIGTQGLLPALMKLNDLTKEYGVDTMADIFPNIRALSGVLDLLGANMDENIKSQELITNSAGALDHAFATVAKTWKFQLNQAIREGQTLMVELGETIAKTLTPTIKNIFDSISSLVSQFTNLTSAQQKTIVHIGLFATALGPVIILLNVLKASIIPVFTSLYLWFGKSLKELLLLDTAVNKYVGSIKRELVANEARINSATKYTAALVKQRLALLEASRASVKHSNAMLALMQKSALGQTTFAASTGSSLLMTKRFNTAMLQQGVTMANVATKGAVANTVIKQIGASLLAAGKSAALAAGRFAMTSGYVAILALLGTALVGLIKKHKDASAAQEALNDTNKEAARIYAKEAQVLNRLSGTAQSEYTTKEMREQAIIRLNNLAPVYLRNLSEENIRTKEGTKLIDEYREALERKAQAQAASNALIELEQKRIEEVASGTNKTLTFWERAAKGGVVYAATGTSHILPFINAHKNALRELQWQQEKEIETEERYLKMRNEYIQIINSSKYALSDFTKQYDYLSEKVKEAEKNDRAFGKTVLNDINTQIRAMDEYLSMLQESWGIAIKGNDFEEALKLEGKAEEARALYTQLTALKTIMEALLPTLFDYEEYAASPVGKLDELFTKLNEDLKSVERANILFGDSYDILTEKLRVYEGVLKEASTIEGSVNDARLKAAKSEWELLKLINQTRDSYNDKLGEAADAALELNEIYENQYGFQNKVADAIERANSVLAIMSLYEEMPWLVQPQDLVGFTLSLESGKQALEFLTEAGLTSLPVFKALQDAFDKMSMYEDMASVQGKLDELHEKFVLLGGDVELLNDQVSLLRRALSTAISAPMGDTDEDKQKWLENVKALRAEYEKTKLAADTYESVQNGVVDMFVELGRAATGASDAMENMKNIIKSVMDDIYKSIVKHIVISILRETKLFSFLSLKQDETNITLKNAAAIATETSAIIANTAARNANAAAGAGGDIYATGGGGLGGVGAGAGMAAGLSKALGWIGLGIGVISLLGMLFKRRKNKMAAGGVVPPGYPNDSYPAMLTSGETVIPPKKLPKFEDRDVRVHVLMEGRVKGRDLYYIMKEEERVIGNSF